MSEATVKGPQVRIRINHKYTAKDGWRLDETTVEVEGSIESVDGSHRLAGFSNSNAPVMDSLETIVTGLLADAYSHGTAEAHSRNNADRQQTLHGVPEAGDADLHHEIVGRGRP